MNIVWRPVFSSHISEVGYAADTQTMAVKWDSGRISAYQGVPMELYESVANSPSVGSAIREQIKGKFSHQYIG